jgi:glutathione synthase/RimK-type ligase-like ATP-grasp enzyme
MMPDDRLLQESLSRSGHTAEPVIWNSPAVDWSLYDAVLIRTTWDYTEQIEEYLAWADHVHSGGIQILNDVDLIRWNYDKRYLKQLEDAGARIVPTRWVTPNGNPSLTHELDSLGNCRAVIKPVISASARRSYVVPTDHADEFELQFATILKHSPAMVQPYLTSIESEGELSLLFIDSIFSHAVRKVPAKGDWRTQPEYGSRVSIETPDPGALSAARMAAKAVPGDPLYTRVDIAWYEGQPCVMELEVIEPALYLGWSPGSADQLAHAFLKRLSCK